MVVKRSTVLEAQGSSEPSTGGESSHRKLGGQTTSDMETDALVKKEVITDTFSQADAAKEEIAEANTEVT